MEEKKGLLSCGFNWISHKLKKIWKHQPPQQNQSEPVTKCNIIDKHPSDVKNLLLMKLRKPDTHSQLAHRIHKINQFFNHKTQAEKPLELVCPICIDYFIKPVTTVCGHTFCTQCLDESILFSSNCPVCRNFIRGTDLIECNALHEIIFRYMGKYEDSIYEQTYIHQDRKAQKWLQNKKINPDTIKGGDLIDVRDTEFIWCRAVVNEVYQKNHKNSSILIHYLGWNSVYDEIIELSSQRLANYKFYTQRSDIPHYHLNHENSDNMHSYVVIGEPVNDHDFNFHLGGNQQNPFNQLLNFHDMIIEELQENEENLEGEVERQENMYGENEEASLVLSDGYVFVGEESDVSFRESDDVEQKEENPEDGVQNKIPSFQLGE